MKMNHKVLFLIIACFTFFFNSNVAAQTVIVSSGSGWKYYDEGINPGNSWIENDYDDSVWGAGNAEFGYGDGDENTVVSYGSNKNYKYITTYFRKKIQIGNAAEYKYYNVNILRDDGAVVYINGKEVFRTNMPSGDIDHYTCASSSVSGSDEETFHKHTLVSNPFHNGENIIAVSVHQRRETSSDLSFDLELTGTNELVFECDGPYVFYRDDQIIVKSIQQNGPVEDTFTNKEDVTLCCTLTNMGESFSFNLCDEISIPDDTYELPEKVLALSDIEGNIEGFKMILEGAGVIDNQFNWTFGVGHLVFIGDMFDRGCNVTECLWLVYKLEQEAEAAGGKVHFILGNHDIMNLIGDLRYVSDKYFSSASVIEENYNDLYTPDTELGRWLRSKNSIEKIGSYIFVHAGISPQVANLGLSLTEINSMVREDIDNPAQDYNGQLVTGSDGVYWYRGMAKREISEPQVDIILSKLNASKIIIGHTVFSQIRGMFSNKVVGIDLDHEENYQNGCMYALLIDNNHFYIIDNNADKKFLFNGVTDVEEHSSLPTGFILYDAYPNPFNPSSVIEYSVAEESFVDLKVYDSLGREVVTLVNQTKSPGKYKINFNAGNLSGGIYLYRLNAGRFTQTKKIVLIK